MIDKQAKPHILIADDEKAFLENIIGEMTNPMPNTQPVTLIAPAAEITRNENEAVLRWGDRVIVITSQFAVAKNYVHSNVSLEAAFLDGIFQDENKREIGTGVELAFDLLDQNIPNIFSISNNMALYETLEIYGYDRRSGKGGHCGKSASTVVATLRSLLNTRSELDHPSKRFLAPGVSPQ